jgi:hypothetical protein
MRADPYLSTKKQIYVQYINVYCIYVQYTKILRSGGCMHRSWMVMGHSDHVFKIRVQTVLNPDHYISCARVASATWATYMREGYNTRWCNCGQHDSVLQRIYIYIHTRVYTLQKIILYVNTRRSSHTWRAWHAWHMNVRYKCKHNNAYTGMQNII